jgi:hypothetical protein
LSCKSVFLTTSCGFSFPLLFSLSWCMYAQNKNHSTLTLLGPRSSHMCTHLVTPFFSADMFIFYSILKGFKK